MYRSILVLTLLLIASSTHAEELSFFPSLDTTLYQSTEGDIGGGAGDFLFAGRTGQGENFIRRTLLAFDLSEIPQDAAVVSAELSLTVDKVSNPTNANLRLHALTSPWTTGDSNPSGGEGGGAEAVEGDATWLHSSFPDDLWTFPGGDFVKSATDSIAVGGPGQYTWGQGGALINDVQAWIVNPTENFGWAIMGGENQLQSARRFFAGNSADVDFRPVLRLELEGLEDCNFGDQIGDLDGDGTVRFRDFLILSSNFGKEVETYQEGDLDCDGLVGFTDFLRLSANFGKEAPARAVPEPSFAVSLTLFACALLVGRRKPRYRQS